MKNKNSRRGRLRGWAYALGVAWTLTFAAAAIAADADTVAQGEALVKAGRYADAYQLLEPLEDRLAGDTKYDYLLARSALETGRPSKASFIYERILAVEPNYVGMRLEMGRAYLALGDYARAKLEFEAVLRFENLPPGLREQAQVYGKAAEEYISGKKTVFNGYAEYGFGYDSNAQSVTKFNPLTLTGENILELLPEQLKRSDHYNSFVLGGEAVRTFGEGWTAFFGLDTRGRVYNNIDAADFYSVDARTGIGYASGAHNTRISISGGAFWLNDIRTRDSAGQSLDYRYLATKTDQISIGLSGSQFSFIPEAFKSNDFRLDQGSLGWLHGSSDGRSVFGFTALGGVEKATGGRADGNKTFYGGRVVYQAALTDNIGVFLIGGVQRGKYSQLNVAFDLTRVDRLYDATLGLTWSFTKGWSLRPQVVRIRNKSSIPLFEFDRTDASLNVRLDF
jgi:outer membrane protein